jgi:NADPH-dependent ferric siderophore reductase
MHICAWSDLRRPQSEDFVLADTFAAGRHAISRVRHELKRRIITVRQVTKIAPHMVRMTFGGVDLAGFASPGFDDHVKLFWGDIGRHYTPRHFDADKGELDIDFALHDAAGPATRWAGRAKAGDAIAMGGPRGSMIVPDDFDWYLLAGDETALPAIARRLEALRPGVRAIVVAEVGGKAEEIELTSRAAVETHWVHRGTAVAGTGTLLEDAIAGLTLPKGEGFAWAACEAAAARRVRTTLIERHHHPKEWLKVASYWKYGVADVHETLSD